MDESRDENTVTTDAINQTIPVYEQLPNSIVTILGNYAATIWKREQRVRCGFGLLDKSGCVALRISRNILGLFGD